MIETPEEAISVCIKTVANYLIATEGYTSEEIIYHDLLGQLEDLKLDIT